MMGDKKKNIGLILAKANAAGDRTQQTVANEDAPAGPDDSLKAISEDILRAVDQRSVEDLTSALKAFCSQMDVQEDPEDQE